MKLKTLHTIWQVPVYLPYLKPALTDEMVHEAETKIGYKLPKDFTDLLKTQNGGYIRYRLEDTPHSLISGIGATYPSFTEFEWLMDYEGAVSYELKGLFAFDGDGHWNLCLDYRKNSTEPEVTYIDTETDYEKKIANNFKEYLGLLSLETENVYVIQSELPIEEIVKQISSIADISFNEPDSFAHGYPIYSAKLGDDWVWLSANKVPAGFIRPGEDNYEALKHRMETYALRYPELSQTDLLLSISSEEQKLIETLHAKGLTIIDLKSLVEESR